MERHGQGEKRGAAGEKRTASGEKRTASREEVPLCVWVLAPTGELEWSNDVAPGPEALHPADASEFMQSLRRSLKSGHPLECALRMRCPNAEYRWVEVRAWPVRRGGGPIEHWVGIATDVEARTRRESLLDAVESPDSPFALVLVDRDFRLLRANLPRGLDLLVNPPWLEGTSLAEVAPDVYEQLRPAHERILAGGGPEAVEVARTSGGEERNRLLLFYPARVRGELIDVGIVDVDVTDRKRAEGAVAQLAEERHELLEALVQTGERARRKIAADIHGDTLQVLGALRLKLDALGANLHEPEQRAALAEIEETFALATERLRALLFELWPSSLERTGLAKTVSELLAGAEREGLHTRLEVDLHSELPLELRGVIYRVIAEALTNVRRHARDGVVEVQLAESDGTVRAHICDDGVGFDPSAAPFGHVGLQEMSDRVHAVGGEIEIRSAPGQGAEIRFSVPVRPHVLHTPPESGTAAVTPSQR